VLVDTDAGVATDVDDGAMAGVGATEAETVVRLAA